MTLPDPRSGRREERGGSSIIGVAVLVTVTVLSMAALTAAAGTFVADGAAAADSQRVADDLADIGAGERTTRVEFSRGTLRLEPRTVRVLRDGGTVSDVDVDALVYENRDRRVTSLGGALVVGRAGEATVRGPFPVVPSGNRLLVDVVALNASGPTAVGGSNPTTVTVRTDEADSYRTMDEGRYAVAVETTTPAAWERAFEAAGMTHSRRDFDDDGVGSVVGTPPDEVVLDLALRDLRAVIRRG
jgi:FlaG/FlaF family flagellin (archaellin)